MAQDLGCGILPLKPFRDMEGMPGAIDVRQKAKIVAHKDLMFAHELGTIVCVLPVTCALFLLRSSDVCAAGLFAACTK